MATLVDEEKPAGYYGAIWNGRGNHGDPVASGTYFYGLKAGDFEVVRRMVRVK